VAQRLINKQKKIEASATMMSTITVVTHTSFHDGQVTLETSCRTSCIKVMGLNFAIKVLS
jgi:hypothetical protein